MMRERKRERKREKKENERMRERKKKIIMIESERCDFYDYIYNR